MKKIKIFVCIIALVLFTSVSIHAGIAKASEFVDGQEDLEIGERDDIAIYSGCLNENEQKIEEKKSVDETLFSDGELPDEEMCTSDDSADKIVQPAEKNSVLEKVTYINTNDSYKDMLADGGEEKWYRFNISEAGSISVTLTHNYIDYNGSYWRVAIYDSDMNELIDGAFEGNKVSKEMRKFGIPEGIYYAKVYAGFYYSNNKGVDMSYNIKINYKQSLNWETEVNNDYLNADIIKTDNTYWGCLQKNNDVDWYKVNIPQNGNISITFNHDYIEYNGTYWEMTLYDSYMNEIKYEFFKGNKISKTGEKFGVSEGMYYIKISPGFFYSGIPSDIDNSYSIKINYNKSAVWEKESNDNYSQANNINLNNTYYGGLQRETDADWYKFDVTKKEKISFVFKHDFINYGGNYWSVILYDASMNEINRSSSEGNKTSKELWTITATPGTYYIKIYSGYFYTDIPYNFKINTARVSISKLKISIGNLTYTGRVVLPSVRVKYGKKILKYGKDYVFSYSKAVKAGSTITVRITGKGNYVGTVSKHVKIKKR